MADHDGTGYKIIGLLVFLFGIAILFLVPTGFLLLQYPINLEGLKIELVAVVLSTFSFVIGNGLMSTKIWEVNFRGFAIGLGTGIPDIFDR